MTCECSHWLNWGSGALPPHYHATGNMNRQNLPHGAGNGSVELKTQQRLGTSPVGFLSPVPATSITEFTPLTRKISHATSAILPGMRRDTARLRATTALDNVPRARPPSALSGLRV